MVPSPLVPGSTGVQTIAGKIVRGQPRLTGIDKIIVASDTPDADETTRADVASSKSAVDLIAGSTSRCGERNGEETTREKVRKCKARETGRKRSEEKIEREPKRKRETEVSAEQSR